MPGFSLRPIRPGEVDAVRWLVQLCIRQPFDLRVGGRLAVFALVQHFETAPPARRRARPAPGAGRRRSA